MCRDLLLQLQPPEKEEEGRFLARHKVRALFLYNERFLSGHEPDRKITAKDGLRWYRTVLTPVNTPTFLAIEQQRCTAAWHAGVQ